MDAGCLGMNRKGIPLKDPAESQQVSSGFLLLEALRFQVPWDFGFGGGAGQILRGADRKWGPGLLQDLFGDSPFGWYLKGKPTVVGGSIILRNTNFTVFRVELLDVEDRCTLQLMGSMMVRR